MALWGYPQSTLSSPRGIPRAAACGEHVQLRSKKKHAAEGSGSLRCVHGCRCGQVRALAIFRIVA